MPGELSGRVALVTGASRGIGRACAEAFIRSGATVVGCDLHPTSDLRSRRYRHRRVDVAIPAEVTAAVTDTVAGFGRLDILLNNAGTHPPTQAIDEVSFEDFDRLVHVNLRSVFVACRAALPALRRTHGVVLNMASAVGLYGQEGAASYCATKAGIIGLTKALAIDEAPNGVRVNAVCPGAILTPLAKEAHPPKRRAKIASWAWLNRWGTPEEVAELVLFLASDRSAFITGQNIVIGGGTELGYGFKGPSYYREMGIPAVVAALENRKRARGTRKQQRKETRNDPDHRKHADRR
jgi:NAD(P)-dependent dehydrogenase (short-subunit alcohol dehydrogenase family)